MGRILVGIGTGILNVRAYVGGVLGAFLVTRADDQLVLRNNDTLTIR